MSPGSAPYIMDSVLSRPFGRVEAATRFVGSAKEKMPYFRLTGDVTVDRLFNS